MLKNLLKKLNNLYPLMDFLYILQLEEYETSRYLVALKRLFFRRNFQKRGKLVLTFRAKITLLLSIPLSIILPPLTPIFIGQVNIILNPFFEIIKLNLQNKAKIFFNKVGKNTKVIAIAGSFGKTTTKNYIYELIKYNYKTQMVPGNINTPTGIAKWILDSFDPSLDILIVEVDTYFVGEITRSLKITPPDIAILTNVGDQHLERLGNKSNLRKALHEVFDYSKPNVIKIQDKKSNLEYALEVARILKIPNDIIDDTIKNLAPPERRGNIIKINNFEVIDNSYNISETTAIQDIKNAQVISKKHKKKLIVITAGIPELGEENKDGNFNLGSVLNRHADKIILLKSILRQEIEAGIKNKNLIIYAESMKDALDKLKEFDSKKYTVLMQPELNDLYY